MPTSQVTKNLLELPLFYALTESVGMLGIFNVTGAAEGNYVAETSPPTFPTGGCDIFARVHANPLNPAGADIALDITGEGVETGAVTLKSGDQEGQAYVVSDGPFTGLTDVQITAGGSAGDKVSFFILPLSTDWNALKFLQNFNFSFGEDTRDVYNRYVIDHRKRIRGERTVSFAQLYQAYERSGSYLRGREFTLMGEIEDDGGGAVTETWYFVGCRAKDAPVNAGGEDANFDVTLNCTFQYHLIVAG